MAALPMLDDVVIRPFKDADLQSVLAIERQCHSNPWSGDQFRRECENPLSRILLLEEQGTIAGFVCAWTVADELHIHNVATAPAFRRRGVARRLLDRLFELSRCRGVTRAFLEVRVSNTAAIALYRDFGFRPTAVRPAYYADGEDAQLMERRFEGPQDEA